MYRDASDELTSMMPIIAHESVAGVDCCGCIIAAVEGSNVELVQGGARRISTCRWLGCKRVIKGYPSVGHLTLDHGDRGKKDAEPADASAEARSEMNNP